MDSSWPLATFRIGPARKSSPFDLIIYPLLSTLVRSRWRDIGLAFFAFWLTLTSSRSYPLCQRLFMRGFRFRSTLKKWPTRKACVVDKRVGWVLAKCFFFFVFMDRNTLATRGLFLRATTSFVDRGPRTRAATPREKTTWYPGYLGLWKRKKQLGQYPAIMLVNTHAFRTGHFLRLHRNRKPRMKSRWPRVGPKRSQGQSKR